MRAGAAPIWARASSCFHAGRAEWNGGDEGEGGSICVGGTRTRGSMRGHGVGHGCDDSEVGAIWGRQDAGDEASVCRATVSACML